MKRRSLLMLAAAAALAPVPALALPAVPRLRRLDLVNAHTGEHFSGPYRNAHGPIPSALHELSYFLRDFHCGKETRMDVGVLDFLAAVCDAAGETRATVLSAYRTPATNRMLMRTTFGVAEHSQHLYGRAIDVYFPARLHEAMLHARAMRRGGVGWYPQSHFIHLDSGPVRNWTLSGHGFSRLLVDGASSRHVHDRLEVSADGEFVSRRTGQPIAPTDRLALHRLLQRAIDRL